jgi:hypothetical protein
VTTCVQLFTPSVRAHSTTTSRRRRSRPRRSRAPQCLCRCLCRCRCRCRCRCLPLSSLLSGRWHHSGGCHQKPHMSHRRLPTRLPVRLSCIFIFVLILYGHMSNLINYTNTGYYHTPGAGPSSSHLEATLEEIAGSTQHDIIGSSQLGGAPPIPSQEPHEGRPQRHARSPECFTFSEGHVRAVQRPKRPRARRGG